MVPLCVKGLEKGFSQSTPSQFGQDGSWWADMTVCPQPTQENRPLAVEPALQNSTYSSARPASVTVRSALVDTALGSSARHILITPTTVTNCPQVANQGFGYVCAYLTTPPSAITTTTSAMVFDRRFRLPAVQQGSLTIEREVGAGVIASATYLVNIDRQLPNSVDINIAPATATKTFHLQGGTGAAGVRDGETFAVPFYSQRVDTNFGPVTDCLELRCDV